MKKILAILVLAVGVASSAFTVFDTPPQGAGVYLVIDPAAQPADVAEWNSDFLGQENISAELPTVGTSLGQCAPNSALICAVKYDASGNLIDSRAGAFVE